MSDTHTLGFTTRQLHAGQQPDPTTGSPRGADLSDHQLSVQEHRARGQSVRPEGIRQYLHPHHEPDHRRAGAAHRQRSKAASAHWRRARARRAGAGHPDPLRRRRPYRVDSQLYGGTYNQFRYTFPRIGIDVTFVDPSDPENFERAIQPNTKIIYGETFGNPDISVFPFDEVAAIARKNAIPLMIDNTFATPYLCRPFEWGANIVVHSTTKFLGGHGTTIGGVIVDGGSFDWTSGQLRQLHHARPVVSRAGLRSTWALPAFILKARVQILRDLGGVPGAVQ